MKLSVPLQRQKKDSADCGVCGLVMELNYYNNAVTYEQLKKEIKVTKDGTYMPQLGTYLLNQGFQVEIITLNPRLFTIHDKTVSSKELIKRCEEKSKTAKSIDKQAYQHFITFLKKGGKVTPRIPSTKDIAAEIKQGRPVFALLTSNFLTGKKPRFNFHFNLITGIDKKYIYVNDPMWDDRGGKKKHDINEFMYGIYASAYGAPDNACIMKIKPRKYHADQHRKIR